ncbi:MAG TPA: CocE/NonD family hydrolase [Gammaproteobacteria bacterium]|nr:CocE/NonD family hydrolase [Gammaproteobacteria bacterium]
MKSFAPKILLLLATAAPPTLAPAQDFGIDVPASADDSGLPEMMRDLAERIVPVYQDDDSDRYLSNLAALQLVLGDPAAAQATRRSLQERLKSEEKAPPAGRAMAYEIYTQARAIEATERVPFTTAYIQAFRDALERVDDLHAYELEDSLTTPVERLQDTLQRELDKLRGKSSIELDEALDLVRAWFAFEAYRSFGGVALPLLEADKERRYVIDEVTIPVAKDATVAARLVRPRAASDASPLPTLLEFTLDRSRRDARVSAAHGYASVLALARIAGDPKSRPRAPFESDGDDARAVIEWIAKQPWSDGRVGMQGAGYGGFVAWSAAKQLPAALKAIATSDPMAPGIDVPMSNGIVQSSAYRWVYELLAPPDDEGANDDARWRSAAEDWYRSGRSYRELPALPGRASAIFRNWLNHPSYDRFWQKWLPSGEELARMDIPVLTVTGYYSAGETGALYYFTLHHRHAANADHALLIGPFDERGVERGASSSVGGLGVDPVARIDPNAARYEWFDHVLKDAQRPALLRANVNYEVAGANEWRHADSLEALEANLLRFYLAASPNGATHALAAEKPSTPMALTATLDLGDRSDADWQPPQELVLDEVQPRPGEALFATEPLGEPVDLAGRLRGELDFTVNKQDVDLVMMLYELRPDGRYAKLLDPAYTFRASYARDRVHRRLLMAGVRQQLPFQSERMVGHRLEAGSRLVLSIGIDKRADRQVNYGAGSDVSEESIEAAGAPVRIRWHEGSFVEIPAR